MKVSFGADVREGARLAQQEYNGVHTKVGKAPDNTDTYLVKVWTEDEQKKVKREAMFVARKDAGLTPAGLAKEMARMVDVRKLKREDVTTGQQVKVGRHCACS